jgi:hypothetical protein
MRKRSGISALISLGCGLAVLLHTGYRTLENHNRLAAIQQQRADELRERWRFIFGRIDAEGTDLEKDLFHDVYVADTPVAKLVEKYRPDSTEREPGYVSHTYSGPENDADHRVTVIAVNGNLVQATATARRGENEILTGYFFGHDWCKPFRIPLDETTKAMLRSAKFMFLQLALTGPIGVMALAESRER